VIRPHAGFKNFVRRRWLVIVAVVAAIILVSAGTYIGIRVTGHGDPDPGGLIADSLRSIDVAIPDDATDVQKSLATPKWSSCGGREGTYGWTDIDRFITFSTAQNPDDMARTADVRLRPFGWSGLSKIPSVYGPASTWTRTLSDGTPLNVSLSPESNDNGHTIFWSLTGVGRPRGPIATGC
jgi:hypothetical protein